MILKNFILAITGGVMMLLLLAGNVLSQEVKSVWMKSLPYESWMNATMMGVKVGYMHIRVDRARYNGQDVRKVDTGMFTELKRFGASIKLMKTKLFYINEDLTPLYFLSRSDETGQDKIVEGTVQNGTIMMKTTLEGRTTEKQQKLPPDIIFAEALEDVTVKKGLTVGKTFSLKTFSLDLFDIINVDANVVQKEKITYKGQTKEVFVVDYKMDIMGGITTREWMTADGEVYKMETLGMGMTFLKVDKEEAMGDVGQLDLILKTKIDLVGEKPETGITKFIVSVSIPEGDISKTFVNNDRQKVTVGNNRSLGTLDITIHDVNADNATKRPITSADFKPYLSPSIYIQSDDPDIINKAQEIAGNEENSWKAAVKVCKWVNENMRDKNYKVGFGTAKQTLKDLSGDCSEHTVLFIGLARALGIPSRICTGLVYHKDAFYYHFWPEVYIGRWISMEPTLGQIQADASHLMFSSIQIETESNLELGEGVIRTLNKLKIVRAE
jgi:hypothetical protein